LDCDAAGRLYVSDKNNNRVQIFSPDGKHLKTIPVDRPHLLRVHQKTGAIYVQHMARLDGRTLARLTKFTSFDRPNEEFHVDHIATTVMSLDSWSPAPRLWLSGAPKDGGDGGLAIYEEQGKTLKKIVDFNDEAKKEAGENYLGRWSGSVFDKVACDPTRERLYYQNRHVFDLPTGKRLGALRLPGTTDDLAFDKRGFLHTHFNPCFYGQGVGRLDPSGATATDKDGRKEFQYAECPYDYGVEALGWKGVLPTKCQPGAKGFQDGLGVNMHGEVAVQSNIYHVPRMEEEGWNFAAHALIESAKQGDYVDGGRGGAYNNVAAYLKMIKEKEQRGEEVYSVRRQPGVSLAGATIWTYEWSGELRRECAGHIGELTAGVQMDEDGDLYFTTNRLKLYGNRQFLAGRGGVFGAPEVKFNPYLSTLIKSGGEVKVLKEKTPIPLEPPPARPADLLDNGIWPISGDGSGGAKAWVEGAKWLYAGTGPMVGQVCSCPSNHSGLDWYKRVFTPEAYRRSLAALDTNGNLILHIGRFGNFDDAPGGKNGAKPGGDDLGIMLPRFVSATDNYLVFDDWGERLVVLKLAYHVEATVPILLK
jgi:hypothetical protein